MTIAKAFPDFDISTLPAIPAGFEDASWKNDACPRYINKNLGLCLWIDYLDVAERENAGPRFILEPVDTDDDITEVVSSDDFATIEAAIVEEVAMVEACLADLEKNDGAALYWQLDNKDFIKLHKRGVIAMDGDLFIHPKANKVTNVAYTMKKD